MLAVPPDGAYPGYIDLRVLCLLACLMAVVAGVRRCGAFEFLAAALLRRSSGGRILGVILVLLPFFTSMLVTNDVALLTFVPFTLLLLDQIGCRDRAAMILVLQTMAANLGSMATPVGNPQNLYLYGAYNLTAGSFFCRDAAADRNQSGRSYRSCHPGTAPDASGSGPGGGPHPLPQKAGHLSAAVCPVPADGIPGFCLTAS